MNKKNCVPGLLIMLLAPAGLAGQTDITFIVAGKTGNHRQGEAAPFADSGYALEMHGGRYAGQAVL